MSLRIGARRDAMIGSPRRPRRVVDDLLGASDPVAVEDQPNSALRRGRSSSVVTPMHVRPADRSCSRPACPAPASATLSFRYEDRLVVLGTLLPAEEPASYDLCLRHAERSSAPVGWTFDDERPASERASRTQSETIAVLAAALKGPSGPVTEQLAFAGARASGSGGSETAETW